MRAKAIRYLTCLVGLSFVLIFFSQVNGLAYRMVLMNLEEMTKEAQRIVVGVCLERKEGEKILGPQAPPIQYREYTFQVTEVLKGNVGKNLTIRQVNLGGRKGQEGSRQFESSNPLPLPDYQPGQEVLLFLGGDSVLGFSSPVGMEQAVFDIQREAGEKFLQNRFGNRSIFRGMSAEELTISKQLSSSEQALFPIKGEIPTKEEVKTRERIPFTPFISLLRKLAQEK